MINKILSSESVRRKVKVASWIVVALGLVYLIVLAIYCRNDYNMLQVIGCYLLPLMVYAGIIVTSGVKNRRFKTVWKCVNIAWWIYIAPVLIYALTKGGSLLEGVVFVIFTAIIWMLANKLSADVDAFLHDKKKALG